MLRIVSLLFLLQLLSQNILVYAQNNELTLKTVVIDAGHGGKDPGTLIGSLKEKDIVLNVALQTGNLIKKHYPEVNVIYTRDTDIFVPLKKRAEIANKAKADLFISIHVNYFMQEQIYGTETYILGNHRSEENLKVAQMENSVILLEEDYQTHYEGFDPNSAESYIMFELIQNEFMEQSRLFADKVQNNFVTVANRRNRGVRQAGFLVLRETVMPSILIELGFISNPLEQKFLSNNKGQTKLAESIFQAFSEYKKRFDDKSSSGIKPNSTLPVTESTSNKKVPIQNIIHNETWHAVQIAASTSALEDDNPLFKDLQAIYEFEENGWYKYYVGLSQDSKAAQENKKRLGSKFKGAFLVTFYQGQKIPFNNQP